MGRKQGILLSKNVWNAPSSFILYICHIAAFIIAGVISGPLVDVLDFPSLESLEIILFLCPEGSLKCIWRIVYFKLFYLGFVRLPESENAAICLFLFVCIISGISHWISQLVPFRDSRNSDILVSNIFLLLLFLWFLPCLFASVLLFSNFILLLVCVCLCVCLCMCVMSNATCVPATSCMWKSEDRFWESALSFHHRLWNWTLLNRLANKHFYLLDLLVSFHIPPFPSFPLYFFVVACFLQSFNMLSADFKLMEPSDPAPTSWGTAVPH